MNMSNAKYQAKYGSEVNSVLSSKPDLMIRGGNFLFAALIIAIVIVGLTWRIPETLRISARLISDPQTGLLPRRDSSERYMTLKVEKVDFEKMEKTGQHTIKIQSTSGDASDNMTSGIIMGKRDSLRFVFLRVRLTEPTKNEFDDSAPLNLQMNAPNLKRSLFSHLLSPTR